MGVPVSRHRGRQRGEATSDSGRNLFARDRAEQWIRWGRLMRLVEAGAVAVTGPAQMVQRGADTALNRHRPAAQA